MLLLLTLLLLSLIIIIIIISSSDATRADGALERGGDSAGAAQDVRMCVCLYIFIIIIIIIIADARTELSRRIEPRMLLVICYHIYIYI